MKEIKGAEVQEIKSTGIENFQNIKPESNITREQANSFWDKFRHSKEVENNNYETGIPDKFYSTIEERQEQLPKDGKWLGEPGNSKFISNDAETNKELAKYGLDGIEYKNGVPDFSKCSIITEKIDKMTPDIAINEKNFCAKLVEKGYFENKCEAREFRKEQSVAFHECADTHTCQLVPLKIHQTFTHKGGRFECRKRDEIEGIGGPKFDE